MTARFAAKSTTCCDATTVLAALDEIEGFRPNEPERSLYLRVVTDVTLDRTGRDRRGRISTTRRWDAPSAFSSGDYLEHLNGS